MKRFLIIFPSKINTHHLIITFSLLQSLFLFNSFSASLKPFCYLNLSTNENNIPFDTVKDSNDLAQFIIDKWDSIIKYTPIHFTTTADFTNARYESIAYFRWSIFDSLAYFKEAQFDSTAFFPKTTFWSDVSFERAVFEAEANFHWVHFHSKAFFFNTLFKSKVFFSNAIFDSVAFFNSACFLGSAKFVGSVFNSEASFDFTRFRSLADFRYAQFNGETIFTGAQFDSVVYFSRATFKSDCNFEVILLPKILHFDNIKNVAKEIDLSSALINPKYGTCFINLINSNIDKIKLRYESFQLYFPDNTSSEIKMNVYEKLLFKTKKEGFINSYEKLDKEYKKFQYQEGLGYSMICGKFLNWIDKTWWGYGYNKEYVIRNTIVIYLLFSFINVFILRYLVSNVYTIANLTDLTYDKKNKTSCLKIVPYSLFYTGLLFFGLKISIDKLKYKENLSGWKVFNLLYIFVIYLSGILCLAYLANYFISV